MAALKTVVFGSKSTSDKIMKARPADPVQKVNYDATQTENNDLAEQAKRRRSGRYIPTVLNEQTGAETLG